MRWGMTPDYYHALKQRQIRVAFFFELTFALTTVRLWTRFGTIQWQGVTWYGTTGSSNSAGSSVVEMTPIEESSDIQATDVTLTLSGAPIIDGEGRNLLELVNLYAQQGQEANIYVALFNLATNTIISDPLRAINGRLDAPVLQVEPNKFTISITIQNQLGRLQGKSALRYDNESQRQLFPADSGFSFAAKSFHQFDTFQ